MITNVIQPKGEIMATALDVAQFFIACAETTEDGEISNLKLQKLVYYAQGFHLAIYGQPLFEEDLEAWTHGPVAPSVYHHYKRYGSSPIPVPDDYVVDRKFSEEQLDLLREIYDVFGQFSAGKLRNMTHSEPPWLENEKYASRIPKDMLLEYFKTRLKK